MPAHPNSSKNQSRKKSLSISTFHTSSPKKNVPFIHRHNFIIPNGTSNGTGCNGEDRCRGGGGVKNSMANEMTRYEYVCACLCIRVHAKIREGTRRAALNFNITKSCNPSGGTAGALTLATQFIKITMKLLLREV